MALLVASNSVAIILLVILCFSGLVTALGSINSVYKKRKKPEIFKLQYDKVKDLKNVLSKIDVPFTFEIAVSQLGKEKACYISLPSGRSKNVISRLGGKRIYDYDLYYPGGSVIGAYAKGEGSLKDINAEVVDFSEVNEIGEGAVVQFVFRKKGRGRFTANVRALVSAPSPYQAKEILNSIKSSMSGVKMTDIKNDTFIDRVNSRTFDGSDSVVLSI